MLLSREQDAVAAFRAASDPLLGVADDRHGTGLLTFAEALVQAVSSFGVSELYARQAERAEALDAPAGRAVGAMRQSAAANEKGIRSLAHARTALKQFREDLAGFPADADLGGALEEFQQELRGQLVDLEVKAADVAKIDGAFLKGAEAVRARGAGRPARLPGGAGGRARGPRGGARTGGRWRTSRSGR